jgi:hypothetical protein
VLESAGISCGSPLPAVTSKFGVVPVVGIVADVDVVNTGVVGVGAAASAAVVASVADVDIASSVVPATEVTFAEVDISVVAEVDVGSSVVGDADVGSSSVVAEVDISVVAEVDIGSSVVADVDISVDAAVVVFPAAVSDALPHGPGPSEHCRIDTSKYPCKQVWRSAVRLPKQTW